MGYFMVCILHFVMVNEVKHLLTESNGWLGIIVLACSRIFVGKMTKDKVCIHRNLISFQTMIESIVQSYKFCRDVKPQNVNFDYMPLDRMNLI